MRKIFVTSKQNAEISTEMYRKEFFPLAPL